MEKVNRSVAWIMLYCFFGAQIPLFAQGPAPMPIPPVPLSSLEPSRLLEKSANAVPAPAPKPGVHVTRLVGPQDAVVMDLNDVRLEIPAGALKSTTPIEITRLPETVPLDEGMSNVTVGAQGYRFEPHGLQFLKPVRITMAFDPAIADSQTALSNLYTYFFNSIAGRWERLERETIDNKTAKVISLSLHFTDMINATLKLPEGPQPIQYDVNSIKNLEAANPTEGVPMPDGPQPGPFGAASFRIPLRLPLGRGGASPQLSLRYSSDTGETWLGKGFDIEVPSITIDTRFGLPHYDIVHAGFDRYSMDGEELLSIGADTDDSLLFQPRVEKRFARIRWYNVGGAGGEDDYWQVTEKNGAIREYGHTGAGAWLGPDRSTRSKTFVWYLSKERDSFGNTVNYVYVNDSNNYTYLSDIYYSGFETTGDRGVFHVQFVLEGAERNDKRIDSRGGFISKLASRLSQIKVFYSGASMRTYDFTYVPNEFGQSLLSSYSETNGGGTEPFYTYSFDYYSLPRHPDQTGYDAFGEEEQFPVGGSIPFKGLNSTVSTAIGGDLYLGLEIFIWLPFWGKETIANFGVRGGLQFTSGGTAGQLIDANGDGLADLVWNNGGNLNAYLNTGSGFDTSSVFSLPGLPGVMDEVRQNSFNFGISATLFPIGGALSWQESWSLGQGGFMDVNGDGLVDYANAGSSNYALNTGSALVPTPWGQIAPFQSGATPTAGQDYNMHYYVEEPFRAWKSYRSGTVMIAHDASLLRPATSSYVSLFVDPPAGPASAPLHLTKDISTLTPPGQEYSVNAGDRIYFYADGGTPKSSAEEASQKTRWNVKIHYTGVNIFEYLKDGAMFEPPLSGIADQFLKDTIYTTRTVSVPFGGQQEVTQLKDHWWLTLDEGTLAQVYDRLIDLGYFVPRRVPRSTFETILNAASNDSIPLASQITVTSQVTHNIYAMPILKGDQAILAGFDFEPETNTFLWKRTETFTAPPMSSLTDSDQVFMHYMQGTSVLSRAEKQAIALPANVASGAPIAVQQLDAASVGYVDRVTQSLPATLTVDGLQGNMLPDKGLLLETTYDATGVPIERLWLRSAGGNPWSLVRESAKTGSLGQLTVDPILPSVSLGASLVVGINDGGVARGFTFTGKSAAQQIPDSIYTQLMSPVILAGQVFSTQAYLTIPATVWTQLTNNGDPNNSTFKALSPCYALGQDGDYHVADPSQLSATDFDSALLALQAASTRVGTFVTPDSNPTTPLGLILLTQPQKDSLAGSLAFGQQAEFAACFLSFTDTANGTLYYYQDPNLNTTQLALVLAAMKSCRRDVDIFPYYTYDSVGNVWNIRPGADAMAIKSVMDSCGIQTWTSLTRTITYSSTALLPVVTQESLPLGANVDQLAPPYDLVPHTGESVGVVMVPTIDRSSGHTVIMAHYLQSFDSLADFSTQNLAIFPVDSNGKPKYNGEGTLAGGMNGWYYGVWSGYYPWNKTNLNGDPVGKGDSKPPYSISVSANLKSDGTLQSDTAPATSWVGNVSSYSDVTMNADLSTTTTTHSFAAFFDGDDFSISRNGGDAYYRLPTGAGSSGETLPFIRSSHSTATDLNGNVPYFSGSKNTSTSWQYQGILDMNGDRYPDLVSFSDSQDGSNKFAVTEGTQGGFGRQSDYSLPGSGLLSVYNTKSYGLGASTSSASGGMLIKADPAGKPESIAIVKPDPTSGSSGAVGMGVNASFGSSVQSKGFYDMNGDGLPDFVTRSDTDSYWVALNKGDGTFAPFLDWGGSGSERQFMPSFMDLTSRPSGLTTTGTGSFGATINASFGIMGASAGFNATVNQTYSALNDVNGDSLPDQVVKLKDEPFFRIRFNMGDQFGPELRLYRPDWGTPGSAYRDGIMQDLGRLSGGLGLSISVPSLPESGSNPLGSAFDPFSLDDDLEYSTGACFNLGGNLTFSIGFWLLYLTITPGLTGSVATTSASLKFTDIDGDGLPDHVLKLPSENFLRVKRNMSGTVGLLKGIALPQGGEYSLTYTRVGNTVDMPQSRWVLSSITRDDGISAMSGAPADRGIHSYMQQYAYSNGYYHRGERLFYGFAQVTTSTTGGAITTTHYLNRDYSVRGMASGSELDGPYAGGNRALYQRSIIDVRAKEVSKGKNARGELVPIDFPRVVSETNQQYQAGVSSFVETRKEYGYDDFGNISELHDHGTLGEPSQAVHVFIEYDSIAGADYQKQSPTRITVKDANLNLMRDRKGTYGSRGELLTLEQFESATTSHRYTITYDEYGNQKSIIDPRGHTLGWMYDDVVHRYVTQVRSFNSSMAGPEYDSSMEWNVALGKKTAEVDQNLQRMSYAYDVEGRLVEVKSPYDSGSVGAVRHQYITPPNPSSPWIALTSNKLLYDAADSQTIQTVIAVDGLGRVLQTAKQGEQRDSLGARTVGWNLSGAIAYDADGRAEQEGQPQFASGTELPGLAAMKSPTKKSYDAQDRVILQVLPDKSIISNSYLVSDAGNRLIQHSIDPLGNSEEREVDGRGNITKVSRLDGAGTVLMSATYTYDGLSQILTAVDNRNNAVQVVYDLLGRRTSLQSPDTGILTLSYDESGNLKQKVTSVLRSKGGAIDYSYDGLNRLVRITYPESAPVKYIYGDPGAPNCSAGRLVERDDESGTVTYQYGKLGETTQMSRTIQRLTPLSIPVSASFSYVSDYLGRLQQITYPDGEVVSYGYDTGGQVQKVTGNHWGNVTNYVCDIGYDEYGQRTYIEYGNGNRTSYSYDADRRWLNSISTQGQYGSRLQNIYYNFDLVGNILGYQNDCTSYSTSQTYSYNSLYQLVGAQGSNTYHPYGSNQYLSSYQQGFAYDDIGNMKLKTSTSRTSPAQIVGVDLNYSLDYHYYSGKPHQAEIIGKIYYRYDANGNMIEEREGGHGSGMVLGGKVSKQGNVRMTDTGFGLVLSGQDPVAAVYSRSYVWDEENRLERTVEGNLTVDYRYGADGQRAVKYSSRGESLYFDSMWQAQTDYPSLRQSKHIYVGQGRVATQLNIQGQTSVDYENKNTYYYHPDHLGSSQLVTDYQGNEYERMEYTPYGESWIEKVSDSFNRIPYKFTGKELDSETGLYYYGARYMDPKTSRWVNADPALGEFLPVAPANDDARSHNENLPGIGGVFNLTNLSLYSYAGNNPLKYMDPAGKDVEEALTKTEAAHLKKTSEEVIANPDYSPDQPNQGDTHCNAAANAILKERGSNTNPVLSPNLNSKDKKSDIDWTNVNAMALNAAAAARNPKSGVKRVSAETAQAMANLGGAVLAVAYNGAPDGHGHAGVVAPSTEPYDPKKGPMIAQQGSAPGIKPASDAFGKALMGEVRYYILPQRQ